MAKKPAKQPTLTAVRRAIANYMRSEGCSCCRASNHDEHAAILAKLLRVPKYNDGPGYDFARFRTREMPHG